MFNRAHDARLPMFAQDLGFQPMKGILAVVPFEVVAKMRGIGVK